MVYMDSTMILQVVLAGAITTTQPQVGVNYFDLNAANERTKAPIKLSTTNSTTDVTICDAPRQNFLRCIEGIHFTNKDTVAVIAIFKIDVSGTETILHRLNVPALRAGGYESKSGWYVS